MLAERYRLSVFDAMIASAALEAGCDTFLSEDMQHGMVLKEGLRITNPFRTHRSRQFLLPGPPHQSAA